MSFDRTTTATTAAASETGYTFEPAYPGGAGIGATITVRGPESEPVRALLKRQLAEMGVAAEASRLRGKKAAARSLDELEAEAIDLAVAYTITWSGFKDGDRPLEPTDANLRAIYRDYSWIRRQVIDEAQDLGNFVGPASKSSLPTPPPSSLST